jgi:hypothetical protein
MQILADAWQKKKKPFPQQEMVQKTKIEWKFLKHSFITDYEEFYFINNPAPYSDPKVPGTTCK